MHNAGNRHEEENRKASQTSKVNESIRAWLWQGIAALVLVCSLVYIRQNHEHTSASAHIHTYITTSTRPPKASSTPGTSHQHTTACASPKTITKAQTGFQSVSIPLWLAGVIGLGGMVSGGLLTYVALPSRGGNFSFASDMSEDGEELLYRNEE